MSDRSELQAEVDRMQFRLSEGAADGSLGRRRGVFEHQARVLRQARARLAALAPDRAATL